MQIKKVLLSNIFNSQQYSYKRTSMNRKTNDIQFAFNCNIDKTLKNKEIKSFSTIWLKSNLIKSVSFGVTSVAEKRDHPKDKYMFKV